MMMIAFPGKLISMLAPVLILTGCLAVGTQPDAAQPIPDVDAYSLKEGTATSDSGCGFEYRGYTPLVPVTDTRVILGHGFLRDQNKLVDLSRTLANAGIPVATLNFCNMRPWNGNHRKNADDMRTLASALGTRNNVIYAGFSAGALAALLAADAQTRAVLTLDLVDQANLGRAAVQQLDIPLLGLHGPAHRCNADNNGLAVFRQNALNSPASVGASRLIANASHCEFESPSNWLCERACGDSDNRDANQQTRQTVMQQALELLAPYLKPLD